ncbi:MAG: OmpA family protein [Paracoccaceae bacterium]
MAWNILVRIGAISAFAALAACTTSPEVTRFKASAGVAEQEVLSALSRQFMAQTPYTVNFDFDMDNLDAQARRDLDIQANWILAHPDVRFSVFGHTDKVGTNAYNEDLGLRRATEVVAYLTGRGINPERLEALVTYGEELPIIQTELRERVNRRATTVVMGFFTPERSVRDANIAPPIIVADNDPQPEPDPEPEPDNGSKNNSGRGNGDELGDPGNSEGHNNGGDEL